MLQLSELSLQRGGKPLFEHVSLTVHPGQKVGLVGRNGCGKSSLLALIRGELSADTGSLDLPARWTLAHVAQETPPLPIPAIEHVLDGDAELRRTEAELIVAEHDHDGHRIGELHARLDAIDGYSARARAGKLMNGLGFLPDQQERPVAEFSGGWRVRLNLARALMARSDLLLLDEPTNHLDLDAVIWLEQWLRSYPGTLLLISHDRDFLDRVVDTIAHVEHLTIRLYTGNYSAFEEQRAARLAQQQAAHARQQREIAHLQSFIDRFRAKATKARQAQSRLKTLARMETVAPVHLDSPFRFEFRAPDKLPDPLLRLERVATGYGNQPVLSGINLGLRPGSRLGLLGRNGAGKSTLIKLLADELPALEGRRDEGQGLMTGYFAQHQLEQLRSDWSPLRHLQQADPAASEQALRNFLGGFGFAGDMALAPSEPFSGGEKARLVLALLVWLRPNLLLLDEPTNHLDLDMRHALTLALQDYPGALVLVSHDRHLLRASCDGFLLVHDGRVRPFDGDLDDYRHWLADNELTDGPSDPGRRQRGEQRRRDTERRQQQVARRRPLERRLRSVEENLEVLERHRRDIDRSLSDPTLYEDTRKADLMKLLQQQADNRRELDRCEADWLALQEELEAIGAD
jgi:ATP-binding cassette, subfamily F, member 3